MYFPHAEDDSSTGVTTRGDSGGGAPLTKTFDHFGGGGGSAPLKILALALLFKVY